MPARPRPRHVLWLTTDHQRYDCVGAAGNAEIHTPALDRLAAGGAWLERCYAQNPVCMPSRCSFMTGRYPSSTRVRDNGVPLPESEVTVAHAFRDAGWYTANLGKVHFLPHFGRDHTAAHPSYGFVHHENSDEPGCYEDAYIRWVRATRPELVPLCRVPLPGIEDRGWFKRWVFQAPEEYSHPHWVADRVTAQIRGHRNQSALICGGFYAPHPPLNPPQAYLDLYDVDKLSLPVQQEDEHLDKPPPLSNMLQRAERQSDEEWRDCKRFFYAMCSHVDASVARIVMAMEEEGTLDDTLLVFMSDHGDTLGDHHMTGKHCSFYESVMRLPVLLHWPNGLGPGVRVPALTEAVDIVPTLLEACGIAAPPGCQGRSLWPLLDDPTQPGREDVHACQARFGKHPLNAQMVRTAELKYIRYGPHHGEVLYDLVADPDEMANQASDSAYADRLQMMRDRLLRRLMDDADPLPAAIAPY